MRKVRRGLDDLLASMRSLPNRIRQYDAYEQLHEAVKGYVAGHGLLSDLKTEALKERHWKTILQRLNVRIPFTDLSVGILWDNGVLTRKKDMLEILAIAQGEMALEVFLAQIRFVLEFYVVATDLNEFYLTKSFLLFKILFMPQQ
jgi:dynein heavy chain 1, cytosolic